jgi:glycosyltransferase involved in cell wall biosynthesis
MNLFKKYPSNECRQKLNIPYQDFVIGYVGVLREWVDLEPVFAVVKRLSRNYRNLKLLIAGEEGGLKKNKELAKRYGISDKVIFTGTIPYEQVPRYISCMDICLIPFKLNAVSESSLPLKLFEYMACEKPVISTKIAGVVDVVQDKVLYASTEEEYRDKIVKLYEDEELRMKLGVVGRSYVKENYEWSKLASKLENVLEEVRNR